MVRRPVALAVLCLWPSFWSAAVASAQPPADAPSSKHEIAVAVRSITEQFGPDAAVLQGHLLAQSVAAGSVLEASVRVGGTEPYDGRPYLAVHVDTGIVYDDDRIRAADRPGLVWREVVRPVLAKFKRIQVAADGLALHLSYRHAPRIERRGLAQRLAAGSLVAESAIFHVLATDVPRLGDSAVTDEELARRVPTTVDGRPVELRVPAPSPTTDQ